MPVSWRISFERAATNIASIRHSRTNGYFRHHDA
jgi:hypothetical protein